MKRNLTNCRHSRAYPTIIAQTAGFLWCPDCGAHRLVNVIEPGRYQYASRVWIYPTGYQDVLKQLERQEKADA